MTFLSRKGKFRVARGQKARPRRARRKLALMAKLIKAGASIGDIRSKLKISLDQYWRFLKRLTLLKRGVGRRRRSASRKKD